MTATTSTTTRVSVARRLFSVHGLVWAVQLLLALAFLAHGLLFLFPPVEIASQMNAFLPRWFQVFLGVAEILGSVGLTLPGLTRVQPRLVAWAAMGLSIVVASATVFHVARGEYSSAVTTAILLMLAVFVAYQRARVRPIAPRRTG